MVEIQPYNQSQKEILDFYKVDIKVGLNEHQVESRNQIYGFNELKEKKKNNPIIMFFAQFKSFIIYILLFAVIVSLLAREYIDASIILVLLVINAVLGFIQEYKAERAIDALKKMSGLKAKVLRNGKVEFVETKFLVPGDVILLEEGSKIPADSRIIESESFQTLEAALTGESNPVSKQTEKISGELTIADRKNMVFSGTIVTKGHAKAIVTSIGMKTEIGKIADYITEMKKEETPLQKKLESLGKYLGVGTLIISAAIFLYGIYKDNLFPILFKGQFVEFIFGAKSWLITSVALAVAAVPEGLPAIVTITLAIGTKRMLKRNALVRKLPSVETLGDTTIICCDKTGTLTKNEMTVVKAFANGREIELGKTEISKNDLMLFKIGVVCNNSSLQTEEGKEKIIGEPTEKALIASALKVDLKVKLLQELKRIKENPFDSTRKMMSVSVQEEKNKIVYVKGAPERVLDKCSFYLKNGIVKNLDKKTKDQILSANENFAKSALRVLAFAYKNSKKTEDDEKDLIFVGLQGMIDPPRDEVPDAIKKCEEAGIRIIMITGDNVNTAEAIAHQIGISGKSMNGAEFAALSEQQQLAILKETSIFARVEPGHKMLIVKLLQSQGEIVAMTGDGVNDAPAIKKSDIGVAMGLRGTDVTKETSDMILLDDNFSTIVNAIEEGRGIRANISKFVNYLVSSNLAEILVIFIAMILNFPLPMTAVMLLWLNLVTDGLPALALGLDSNPKTIMQQKPTKRAQIFTKQQVAGIATVSILITVAILTVFYIAMQEYSYLEKEQMTIKIQTIAFTTMIMMEIVRLQAIRSEQKVGLFSNVYLIFAVASTIILQLLVIYTPLQIFFGTTALTLYDWRLILGATAIIFIINLSVAKVTKPLGF